MVNVGGLDLVDGNKKMILAICWQVRSVHPIEDAEVAVIAREELVVAVVRGGAGVRGAQAVADEHARAARAASFDVAELRRPGSGEGAQRAVWAKRDFRCFPTKH